MKDFLKNEDNNTTIFFHGSKEGIDGKISPISRSFCDFGQGFYIGTKYSQAIDIACKGNNPHIYEIQIPSHIITPENTLFLSKQDWLLYTLYHRGKLEKIQGTPLYKYYQTLDDGKQFVIGAIVDDSFKDCLDAYLHRGLTDNGYFQMIDAFNYGLQIVAKTQEACDSLLVVSNKTHKLNADEIRKARAYSARVRDEGYGKYVDLYDTFEYEKGTTFRELCRKAQKGYMPKSIYDKNQLMGYKNISFPKAIHKRRENEYEPFR